MPTNPEQSTPRTGRQAMWNYLVFALSKSSTLIMTIVLARLLSPADFGLFALALVVINLFDYVKDLGVGAALVQSQSSWRLLAPTGLTLTVVSGIATGAIVAVVAGPISDLIGHEQLAPLIRVLAICIIISAIGAFPAAALRRRIDFRARLIPEFAGAIAKTVLTIALAWQGIGVWSLVYGQLAAVIITTALYWRAAATHVEFGYDRQAASALLKFGVPASALSLLAFAIYNVDYLAIGARLGDTDLGLYTLAYRLPELIVLNLCVVISDVLFSALSRIQHDNDEMSAQYLKVLGVVVALTAPIGLGMAAVAPQIIGVLYGSTYAGAAAPLAMLSIFTVIYSISFHTGDVYKAIGRPGVLTAINAAKFTVMIGPIWWAAGKSITMVATVLIVVECIHLVLRIAVVRAMIGVPVARIGRAAIPPVVAAIVMGLVAWSAARLTTSWPDILELLAIVPLAAVTYGVGLKLLSPQLISDSLRVLRPGQEKAPTASGRNE
ncbi:lipopolysaccharide biosynthesis protein [Smaragdicoccus niigatensis]|uniref:lipopolysaccharide biosynthesis protein n=1 Tax=Smaragdicoccus niigatensis TaxID=359359 RepID=UPI000A483043|nr:lipopolysaccharide biosynthesis protein [Smaragdicoccus niigatensis]